MWLEEDDMVCFRTGGSTERLAKESISSLRILNTEEARDLVGGTDLKPYGAWTKKMPSTGGKSMFLVAEGRVSLWVMEINRSQVPNASQFVQRVIPPEKMDDEGRLWIPNRAINTPLGGLFTIGSIVCVILAVFVVFNWQMPLLGLVLCAAAIAMFVNVK